ncbi:Mg2+ and Co2+ transporter CorA [Sphingopyxis panaciterrae]|uniref:CorA family divalent cation transporter n=1 Tax=Sphingopyxis panaciterrae TaxID=363841 RepID=UPI00141FD113|nr:CorA family divalent cation transporter [Sphingopyxis panaciterrae]NIJ39356.1 Mg2+ and Co2+ transporter CorA [Sphingopyxis panaciterrae]
MQPGLIWGCVRTEAGTQLIEDCDEAEDARFRWLHLNLADQRTLRWIERQAGLPRVVHDLMLARDTHQQAIVEDGVVGLVLQDFERDFEPSQTMQIGALHIILTPDLMLTGRYHPLHSADLVKQRIVQGADIANGAAALALVLGAMADGLSQLVHALGADIQTAEDEFLNEHQSPATRDLMAVRRRAARLHRLIGGMRATLHRLEMDPDLPRLLAPVAEHIVQRLHALDADVGGVQAQLRALRDELDLQTAQRTNRNLYFLSVMSALLLPATLVTGFFGMNTGGLPFAHSFGGTLFAAVLAVAASSATWLLLRRRT